jgi:hypothetical protein
MEPRHDIPGAPARFHGVVHGGAPLARPLRPAQHKRAVLVMLRGSFRQNFPAMREQGADVLEVLAGKVGKDRDVEAVLRKCAGLLGQAEPCEPIGNFLHRRPRPAEFGLVDRLG